MTVVQNTMYKSFSMSTPLIKMQDNVANRNSKQKAQDRLANIKDMFNTKKGISNELTVR